MWKFGLFSISANGLFRAALVLTFGASPEGCSEQAVGPNIGFALPGVRADSRIRKAQPSYRAAPLTHND
eukprot:3261258-Alexandrium_andersonii.AAC.1